MGIGEIFGEIAKGLTSFAPALGQSIWEMFKSLFLVTAAEGGAITGFNLLGTLSIVSIVVGLCLTLLPTAVNWIVTTVRGGRKQKVGKKAKA